uniref:Polypeptide N-acetylgalactosaminyltransferase 9 n=1 Tax=Timema monikensis TaxID=170555 RepID=A0A7R9EFQ8_9NEOP|nr:unnamed protein product [Timema monikensis]
MMALFYRRRSLLLKVVLLVFTAWFTVAFLLYTEQRGQGADNNVVVRDANEVVPFPAPQALIKKEVKDAAADFPQVAVASSKSAGSHKAQSGNVGAVGGVVQVAGGPEDGVGGVLVPPRDMEEDNAIPQYGEMGKAVVLPTNLTSDVKKLVDDGWQKNAFNQYASDLISVHRNLPDPRDPW